MNKFLNYKILSTPVRTYIRHATIGAVGGLGTGLCLRHYKENPGVVGKYAKYSLAAGFVAGLRGAGVGALMGKNPAASFFTQTLMGSSVVFAFFSIRARVSSEQLVLPSREEPVTEEIVTSVSTGLTMAGFSALTGGRILPSLSYGLVLGFIGHWVYTKVRILRLEFLLKMNYPELVAQLKDAEDYMDGEQATNPNYRGPTVSRPWTEWILNYMDAIKRAREKSM